MTSSNGNIFRVTGPLPFMRGIHRSVDSSHKDQWHGALMFSLISAWTNGYANNRNAGDLSRHRAHYDVTVMCLLPDMLIKQGLFNGCNTARILIHETRKSQSTWRFDGCRWPGSHLAPGHLQASCKRSTDAICAMNEIAVEWSPDLPDLTYWYLGQ